MNEKRQGKEEKGMEAENPEQENKNLG